MASDSTTAQAPSPLEWTETFDHKSATSRGRKTVHYGGKVYLPQKRVSRGLGLPRPIQKQIFEEARLPNGELADVVYEIATRQAYISEESLNALRSRFVYADDQRGLGPCRVEEGFWMLGDRPGSDSILCTVDCIRANFAGRPLYQHAGYSGFDSDTARYTRLVRQFNNWLERGHAADGTRIRKVLDTITGEQYLTTRTAYLIHNGRRRTGR